MCLVILSYIIIGQGPFAAKLSMAIDESPRDDVSIEFVVAINLNLWLQHHEQSLQCTHKSLWLVEIGSC